jgi:DNA-binding response OmpR family regulator
MKSGQRAAPRPHVLLVNGAKRDYADALAGAGYRVTTVGTVLEALALRRRPDAVIVELVIPGSGLEQIQEAVKSKRRRRAMTVIALADDAHQEAITSCGATFCHHPCPPDELVGFVQRTLALRPAALRRPRPQGSSRPV